MNVLSVNVLSMNVLSMIGLICLLQQQQNKNLKLEVKPEYLFLPTDHFYNVPLERELYLFDRVVNIQNGINVPFGTRGTVIGIHKGDFFFHNTCRNLFNTSIRKVKIF